MSDNITLDKVYDPQAVEPAINQVWEDCGAFVSTPDERPHDKTYCIVIPPPNVTGALHLGHALNNSLQDILIRYYRMRGFNTLWQPGTDHAGIATQAVVERRIRELEGKSRHDIGRDELVRRIWEWKDEYENRIISQLKLMGCSCDWGRTRFTLDDGLARAVRELFFRMFKDGLIYRGKRLVNWDTELQTAVANDEVYYESVKGFFWHFRYPVIDPQPGEPEHVIIATTRPETMLGDTAVAVNPDPAGVFDKRATEFTASLQRASAKERPDIEAKIEALQERRSNKLAALQQLAEMAADGRHLRLPLVDREIPLIADEWADPTKGSGCVKITPAHDPNDYDVWVRQKAGGNDIGMINVLTADGCVAEIIELDGSTNPHSSQYAGLEFAREGRQKVVADMEARELLSEIEDHVVDLAHSDRSKTAIEPYLSDQWYVRMSDVASQISLGNGSQSAGLAQAAMDAVIDERVTFTPPRYAKSYLDWLGEKRDWCISRQLWWGHRLPVWKFSGFADAADRAELQAELQQHLDNKTIAFQPYSHHDDPHHQTLRGEGDYCMDESVAQAVIDKLQVAGFEQDPDVLDTWFSSQLWPFSTLGWPEQTGHLKQYYPGSVLVTSRDIITLWVARMVLSGLYAIGKVPFDQVYITPKVLDGRGETMSKSKGNGVDPVDIIHNYGADALRYGMAEMTTETQDIRMPVEWICPHCGGEIDQTLAIKNEAQARKSRGEKLTRKIQPLDCHVVQCTECKKAFSTQGAPDDIKEKLPLGRQSSERFKEGRNLCNKLWNSARYCFMKLDGAACDKLDVASLPPEDRWILASLSCTVRRFHDMIASYQYSAFVKELREFFWDDFCDWYLELTKPRFAEDADPQSAATAKQVLALVLDQVLRLWHPVIPFITERIWQQLNEIAPARGLPGIADLCTSRPLVLEDFPPPTGYPALDDESMLKVFSEIQDVTRVVRDLKNDCKVSPKQPVEVTVALPAEDQADFEQQCHIVTHLASIAQLHIDPAAKRPANAASRTVGNLRVYVHDISDDAAERKRTTKDLANLEKQIAGKEKKLGNEKFVANADPTVVAAERERLAELLAKRDDLKAHLAELEG